MKFSTFFTIALQIGIALLLLEAFSWWRGGVFNLHDAVSVWAWAAVVLLIAWGRSPTYVPPEDVAELERRRVALSVYLRWLSNFDDISLVLQNLDAEARGEALDLCWPPNATGPWEVSRLREVLLDRQRARASRAA